MLLEGAGFRRKVQPGSTHSASIGSALCFGPPGVAACASRFFLWRVPAPGSKVLARESARPAGRAAWVSIGLPKMAALVEEFTLSTVVLGAGPDGLLGVEQSDKTDQFLVTDSGRTVVLYKVRAIGAPAV